MEGLKNRMNSLVLELKEKHHRQKQDLLALKKNDRKGRCKQIAKCRRGSVDNNDLSAGIVLRKAVSENDMNKDVKRELSLNVLDEKDC